MVTLTPPEFEHLLECTKRKSANHSQSSCEVAWELSRILRVAFPEMINFKSCSVSATWRWVEAEPLDNQSLWETPHGNATTDS